MARSKRPVEAQNEAGGLTIANQVNLTAGAIHHRWKKNRLNLNPDFQRDEAWTTSQKQLLIDSLLRNFDLPKFYFRQQDHEAFDVVDGQQRCRAICEYFDNEFALSRTAPPVGKYEIKGKKFESLPDDLADRLRDAQLTCMILIGYSDDLVEQLFLRLQNGTPLNPAEKRKAIGGNVRNVVADLAKHKLFSSGTCAFSGKRSQYLDTAAKLLYQQSKIADGMSDIRNKALETFYHENPEMDSKHVAVVRTRRALDFAFKVLEKKDLPIRKYMVLTFVYLIAKMHDDYELKGHEKDVHDALQAFMLRKEENDAEEDENKKDAGFTEFTENARNDSKEAMESRLAFLEEYVLGRITGLVARDKTRLFTPAQRRLIWLKDGTGRCKKCGKEISLDNFQADHIKPWKAGGATSVGNGQVLCGSCNAKKGAS